MRPGVGPFAPAAAADRGSAECDESDAGLKLVVREVGFLKPEMFSARVDFWLVRCVSIAF